MELSGYKLNKMPQEYLSSDKAEKRSNALCIASFDNEVWRQKTRQMFNLFTDSS
jgi:hypothetical protein